MSVAGLIHIARTNHSKYPNRLMIVSSFCVGSVSRMDRYPMFRSVTEANVNPQMFWNISSIVGRGYSCCLMT